MLDTPRITVGDVMPGFVLVAHHGQTVRSADLLGRGPLMIYFYPKDSTPGCTAETCAFHDQYEDFVQAGAPEADADDAAGWYELRRQGTAGAS